MAYLAMMAVRLIELHRVLKPTGSLYLRCDYLPWDPTASHYLRALLDAVFGADSFKNEIVWSRTNSRSTIGLSPRLHEIILFISKTDQICFKSVKVRASNF